MYNYSLQMFLTTHSICKTLLGMCSNTSTIFIYKLYATVGKNQVFPADFEGFYRLGL